LIVPALLKCTLLPSDSVCESRSTLSLPEKPVWLYNDPLQLSRPFICKLLPVKHLGSSGRFTRGSYGMSLAKVWCDMTY
jgi:hypothetical protein